MTSGRTPAEVVSRYRQAMQRLLSCVTDSVVDVAGGYFPSDIPHRLALNYDQPVPIGRASKFMLRLRQNYLIVEPLMSNDSWYVELAGYNYVLYDEDQREVVIYHWHPHGNSPEVTPHLHLQQGAQVGRAEVRDAHHPTGQISLGRYLRYLIRDYGVEPRRPDWRLILDEYSV